MAVAYQTFRPSLLLVAFIFFNILFSPMAYAASEGDALIKFKSSLTNSDALSSWKPNTSPCQNPFGQWVGIICYDGLVTGVHLKSMGLSGKIDVDALSNIAGLRSISLEDNKFTGPVPQLNRLGALKALFLSNNEFSGEIPPDYFIKMESLKKLWLSNNKFSGSIPSSLVQLRFLMELHLESNLFTGLVPPFKQPPLVFLDLSYNQLTGEIPASLANFKGLFIVGNPNVCGAVVGTECKQVVSPHQVGSPTPTNNNDVHKNNSSTKVVATSMTVGGVLLSLGIVVACMKKKRKQNRIPTVQPKMSPIVENKPSGSRNNGAVEPLSRKGSSRSSSKRSNSSRKSSVKSGLGDITMLNEERGVFGLADLMKANAEVLGNGTMGSAYKAVMANGLAVAVKRMRELNKLENEGFDEEMRKLAKLRHKNILPPLAYHYRKEEKLVVYEHVAKGSLHFLLHGDQGSAHAELNWPTRLKIIKGTTEGLTYLHSQLPTYDLPHGNLKSSNILINSQKEPVLSDYGFSPMANPSAVSHALFGYRSPEATQLVSPKCDVYCLGIVILEILTCKFPTQYHNNTNGGGTDVVQLVAAAVSEGRDAISVLDPEILENSTSCKESMVQLLHIGLDCTKSDPNSRPSLKEVMQRIERLDVQDGGGKNDSTIDVVVG